MLEQVKSKILLFEDLVNKVHQLKEEGKVVVQSHGVYDLIHPGMIQHLDSAKSQGDILIATVIKDQDVRKGPGRPVFPDKFRAQNVASLAQVDYVCIVDDEKPFECVQRIKPDVFAKGQAYKDRDRKIHQKLFEEEKDFFFGKSKIHETEGFSFSSTAIINHFLDLFPDDTKAFLKKFSQKYSFQDIVNNINSLEDLKVLIIGDGIIDEYHYCEPLGKSAKSHIIVNKYISREVFAGGVFAIANHMAGICKVVNLVTLLGEQDSREEFVKGNLKPNVNTKLFYRDDGSSVIKKRYVNQHSNQKLFEVNFLNNNYIAGDCESRVMKYLEEEVPKYDLIVASDFGHGFITNNIIRLIESKAKMLAVNTQTNAANAGFNMITRYHSPHFICLDEPEIRWAAQERFTGIEEVIGKILEEVDTDYLIATLGKKGSIGITRKTGINRTPIFSTKVVDTIGAGDAFFAFTAPCVAKNMPLDFVSFIGNAVGALAVQIVCNKRAVEKHELLEFIHSILK